MMASGTRKRNYYYTYEVVTNNGAGVHAKGFTVLASARAAMKAIAAKWSYPATFEIQRVRHLPRGSRQYSMRSGSRWVEWDARKGPDVRKPDWSVETRK